MSWRVRGLVDHCRALFSTRLLRLQHSSLFRQKKSFVLPRKSTAVVPFVSVFATWAEWEGYSSAIIVRCRSYSSILSHRLQICLDLYIFLLGSPMPSPVFKSHVYRRVSPCMSLALLSKTSAWIKEGLIGIWNHYTSPPTPLVMILMINRDRMKWLMLPWVC